MRDEERGERATRLNGEATRDRKRDQLRYSRGLRDGQAGDPPEEAAPSYIDGYTEGRRARLSGQRVPAPLAT